MFDLKRFGLGRASEVLEGRETALDIKGQHMVLGSELLPPFPDGCRELMLGMGCFWGAERRLWQIPGVYLTVVGYAGGHTPNPTYEEVCTGNTGHAEVVKVVFDPEKVSIEALLKAFWESHDPTQGMRQGNDIGTQYRSAIYVDREDWLAKVSASKDAYESTIRTKGVRLAITTEILLAPAFYYAEQYHQQYLAKNPDGYCGLRGLGVGYECSPAES
jgi:peptide-methionine (S)-S-oxide reductase